MEIKTTFIEGLKIINPDVFKDKRGYFFESYNKKKYFEIGIDTDFKQDNQSYSQKNVIRALHYQTGEYSQAKLVRVLHGKVLDVAIDLRQSSPTFGKYFSVELSAENKLQFFIPKGFAHGFSVLSQEAVLFYKCDNFYNKNSEAGIIFNDPDLNIDWKIPNNEAIISDRDILLPTFKNAVLF